MWPSSNLRDAGVALGDDRQLGTRGRRESEHGAQQVRRPYPAVGAEGERLVRQARDAAPPCPAEVRPIIVRPAVSKLIVPHQGAPVRRDAGGGGLGTLRARDRLDPEHVGAAARRARAPAPRRSRRRPSTVSGPSGAMISPVGPIEPATTTGRPAASAASRGDLGGDAVQLERPGPRPCAASAGCALPPKLLVRKRSLPASMAPS